MSSSLPQDSDAGPAASKTPFVRYGDFIFKHRDRVFPLTLALVFAAFPPRIADPGLEIPLNLLGIALVVAGLALRAAVIGLAYIKRGGLKKKVYAESLVTDGLFAHCRNPLYVGNLLVVAGYFVIVNNPWAYLLGGGFLLISYFAIVAAEEFFLRANTGAGYVAYCRDVSRWWIDPRGLGKTFASMRFNWRRVIVKDYSTIATSAAIVIGLLAYEKVVAIGFEAAKPEIPAYAAAALACLLAALAVRFLKKRRILTAEPKNQSS